MKRAVAWTCSVSCVTVWNTVMSLCQSQQMLCLHTVHWRFMSWGDVGVQGDHIMQMMALLFRVPSLKTRRSGAGQRVAGIPNIPRLTKDSSLVVLSWMGCHVGDRKKKKREESSAFISLGDGLRITQAACGLSRDDGLSSSFLLMSSSVALKPWDKDCVMSDGFRPDVCVSTFI